MSKSPIKRIEFLAKKFDVFDNEDIDDLVKNDYYLPSGEQYEQLYEVMNNGSNRLYALYTFNQRLLKNSGVKVPKNVRVSDFVFIDIVQSDPTEHKEYVQWMLTTFVRLIKQSEFDRALMFVNEDLDLASDYLEVFNKNRNKPKFKAICKSNLAFSNISDPSDINQYRDLSQLFDAVDPFIDKDVSKLERDIRIMVKLKDGSIPYEDRHVLVFTPYSIRASRLFARLTNWCTTSNKDTYKSYVRGYKTPKGKRSTLYIIIFKTYFLDDNNPNKTHDIYQFHFESGQLMDRKDNRVKDIPSIIGNNLGLGDYFKNTLFKLAKESGKNVLSSKYIDGISEFGFINEIFNIYPDDVEKIKFFGNNISEMPDISRFKDLKLLYITNCKLKMINPSIGSLKKLEILSLMDNKIKDIPKIISSLTNLRVLNISGNSIESLPEEISQLDKINGGSLEILSIDEELVEVANRLLPNVTIYQLKTY